MADELPTMKSLFPEWYAFKSIQLKVDELKERHCSLIKQQLNRLEIAKQLGQSADSILAQIDQLNCDQETRLNELQIKFDIALAHVDKFKIKEKARLLQLGALQRPSREMDWERDTDEGEAFAVKTGFEDQIADSENALSCTKAEIGRDFTREVVMTSNLYHAVTALLIESNFDPQTAVKWLETTNRNGLEMSHGHRLYTNAHAASDHMAQAVKQAIRAYEKREQEVELAVWKQKHQDELNRLKELQKMELQAAVASSHWSVSGFSFDNNPKPETSSTSPVSYASYSTPTFKSIETICDHCKRPGHEMEECWELYPELKHQTYKNLKTRVCNRCQRFGHHENNCFEKFPEKRAAYMKWKNGGAQRGLSR